MVRDVEERRTSIRARIAAGMEKPEIREEDPAELATRGTYGKLPEVHVDQGVGAIFPMPPARPQRISWYQAAHSAVRLRRKLRRLGSLMDKWEAESPEDRVAKFGGVAGLWEEAAAEQTRLSHLVRYLEEWVPQLESQWDEARPERPASYQVLRELHSSDLAGDPAVMENLREALRPRRVAKREYLPEKLSGVVRLPLATDITNRGFLAEVEGAVDTHWNQSPWARGVGVRFEIRWRPVARDARFASGRAGLREHLERFPPGSAILTTGGLTPHVTGRALVLGPGRITPRTLAHEIGHLLGFGDCYLRTLSGQGVFGLAVLEWDNPIYPDDLMCDNGLGVARAEVW